ncbi:hypothetical protein [Micromonospora sp. I033]
MTRIIADISVSLDGFVTRPDPRPDNGLGAGGEALHSWAFSDDLDDRRGLREGSVRLPPVVLGAGTPLFTGVAPRTLVQRRVISTSTATHPTYDLSR